MTKSLMLIQVVQFILSSFLVFGITVLFMEASLYLCKIKSSRILALFRYAPILKLPLDLSLYILSACAYITNFNPFRCQSIIESMIVRFLNLDVKDPNSSYPLAEFLTDHVAAWALEIAVAGVGITFLGMVVHKLFVVLRSSQRLKEICLASAPLERVITNPKLEEALKLRKVILLISDAVPVPSAALGNTILFPPEHEAILTQGEFEAVVAHELDHIRWCDPLLKWTSTLIGSFFWWLPTRWWLKRLGEEQEFACDSSAQQYGLENCELASAIVKISKQLKETSGEIPLCTLSHSRPLSFRRVDQLLSDSSQAPLKFDLCRSLIVAGLGLLLLVIFRIC